MEKDEWRNLYPSKWKGMIVEEAFAHPAKFSDKLIRKIYDHMVGEGWLKPGDAVIDPFGGVALGALDAMRHGLSWTGVELEERFVGMGNDNIKFWNGRFHVMPKWSGDAILLQGDSRELLSALRYANRIRKEIASVSSPPFSDTLSLDNLPAGARRKMAREEGISNAERVSPIDMEKEGKRDQSHYAGAVSSPPYAGMEIEKNAKSIDLEKMYQIYKKSGGGQTYEAFCETQTKHSVGYQGVIMSPPYAESPVTSGNVGNKTKEKWGKGKGLDDHTSYGDSNAQLGSMKATEKGFQAAVTSPPFLQTSGGKNVTSTEGPLADKALLERHAAGNSAVGYGGTEGNMGSVTPDDFWVSAKTIVEQVYLSLEPGGHAAWVVKDFVKGGKRIEFCRMWRELCESVGFITLHEHRAMLVTDNGSSQTLEGGMVEHKKSSKSFFRRLAEKKGSPPIDFETVFCMEKPVTIRFLSQTVAFRDVTESVPDSEISEGDHTSQRVGPTDFWDQHPGEWEKPFD